MAFCMDEERNQAWRRSDHGAAVCAVCCVYLHEIDGQGIRFDVYSEDDSKTVRCRQAGKIIFRKERDTIRE